MKDTIANKISKITLGTVQLGMDYGIANKKGQPQQAESWSLLSYAQQHGITSLDTARHYGNSEEVIGGFTQADQFAVITKFKLPEAALTNKGQAIAEARKSVLLSCKALKTEKIAVCLLHQEKHHPIGLVADLLPAILQELKAEGLIDTGGISVFYPQELEAVASLVDIEAVQVPMNVLDLRLLKADLLQRLRLAGTQVFIRSVFLQGLLFMDIQHLPGHLAFAKKYLQVLQDLARGAGMSVAQLAFSYVRDIPAVTSLVIGAENSNQIAANAALLAGPSLSPDTRTEIEMLFREVPEKLITPAYWTA